MSEFEQINWPTDSTILRRDQRIAELEHANQVQADLVDAQAKRIAELEACVARADAMLKELRERIATMEQYTS